MVLAAFMAASQSSFAGDGIMLSGAEYLKALHHYQSPGKSGQPAFSVEDLSGELSGTVGSGAKESALLVKDGQSFVVALNGASLPPLGAVIRVLARVGNDGQSFNGYSLIAWSFASDVSRAEALLTTPVRQRGTVVSRGGSRSRVDHTTFEESYFRAIRSINPRLSESEAREITRELLTTSRECDIDPRLMVAVVLAESGFNPNATSPKGAKGLGQLMPGTARGMGVSDPYDPSQNLSASIKIIHSALSKYSNNAAWKDLNWGHLKLALAAYNAGSGAVRKYGGIPPYRETQTYIARVSSYYKQLCGGK